MKYKKTVFTIPLWDRDIVLMLGGNWHDITTEAKKYKLSQVVIDEIKYDNLSVGNGHGAAYFCLDKGMGVMWFPVVKVSAGILAHEATHIVDWLLQFIGAEKEMEARAYTVEWLVTNIPKLLNKLKK